MHKLFCFSTDFLQWPLKTCVMQNCVKWRSPIFDFRSRGPSKIEKHLIFDVFAHKTCVSSLILNRFSSNRAQNACIDKVHVTFEAKFYLGSCGSSKMNVKKRFLTFFGHKMCLKIFVSQLIFFKKGAKFVHCQGACRYGARFLILGRGSSKIEKHTILDGVFCHKNT